MQVIAHRGASFLEPENTIRAVERAVKMGADFVEVDVRVSKDNKLVVMHDPDINRTTDGKGLVKDYTVQELKNFDAGYQNSKFWSRKNEIFAGNGETVPTLDEIITCVKDRIGLVIEIKEPGTEVKILEKIDENNLENVILTSFYHKSIKNARKTDPSVDAGIIFTCQPVDVNQMVSNACANIIFPSYRYMNEDMVKQAQNKGISVYPWTIDDPEIFEKFVEMGVDGIVTNKLIEKCK
ncbi:glycerophosphodiester phosphodiesterase family protein [Methanobacterium sp.]|uniref:glycerophosphodiester phosphodiesterase n=1 Tax=Methanobacterium sp. TaxID=2164 RepID=UPI00315908B8